MRYLVPISILAVVTLIGCVESNNTCSDADLVPPSRHFGFSRPSDAHLIVTRERAVDTGCTVELSLDGRPAADFRPGEMASFGLTMGAHLLSVTPDHGCAGRAVESLKILVKAGDALTIRISEQEGLFNLDTDTGRPAWTASGIEACSKPVERRVGS